MSLNASASTKRIGIVVLAIALIGLIWGIVAISSGDDGAEPAENAIGFVGQTKTFVPGDTITESCKLNGDLQSSSKIAFFVGADDITIDGNGYTLTGPGAESGEEAIHSEGHSGVTIKNLNIDYFFGIYFKEVTDSRVSGCTISYSYGSAVWLWSSSGCTIRGNNLGPGEGGHGVLLWDASGNTIRDNMIKTVQGVGISIEEGSNDNRFDENVVCNNAGGDIVVTDSTGNTGEGNTFDTGSGFEDAKRRECS